jgi:hypothetical protein
MASIVFDPLINNHIFIKENGETIFIPFGSTIVIKDNMYDGTINIMMLYYLKSYKKIKNNCEQIYITKNEKEILKKFLKDEEAKALINSLNNNKRNI